MAKHTAKGITSAAAGEESETQQPQTTRLGPDDIGMMGTPLPDEMLGVKPATIEALNAAAGVFTSTISGFDVERSKLLTKLAAVNSGLALAQQALDTILPIVTAAVAQSKTKPAAGGEQPKGDMFSGILERFKGLTGAAGQISSQLGALGFVVPKIGGGP